jgi:hypothetical protein
MTQLAHARVKEIELLLRGTAGLQTKAHFWCSNVIPNLCNSGGQWSASFPGRISLGKGVLTG